MTFDLSETVAHLIQDIAKEEGLTPSEWLENFIRTHAPRALRKRRDEKGPAE